MTKRDLTALLLPVLVVVLGGLAATSASAEVFKLETSECTGGVKSFAICWSESEAEASPLLELKGKQSTTASGGVSTLKTGMIEIESKTVTSSGTIVREKPLEGGTTTIENGVLEFLSSVILGTLGTKYPGYTRDEMRNHRRRRYYSDA